jgi:hypothetical protein
LYGRGFECTVTEENALVQYLEQYLVDRLSALETADPKGKIEKFHISPFFRTMYGPFTFVMTSAVPAMILEVFRPYR